MPTGKLRLLWRPVFRRRLFLIIGFAAVIALIVQLLFVPLPQSVTRQLVLRSGNWILSDYMRDSQGRSGYVVNAGRKTTATFLQYSLVAHFRRKQSVPEGATDPERIMGYLVPLKRVLRDQVAIPHPPSTWPVLLSGLGYCDQVNGVAANLLATEFPTVQIVGVRDPKEGGGHSFGRVWSSERNDWLYFDIWADEVVVFSAGANGRATFLARTKPLAATFSSTELTQVLHRIYNNTHQGWVHNEFRPTFGGYVWLKLGKAMTSATLESIAPLPPIPDQIAGQGGQSSTPAADGDTLAHSTADPQVRMYLEARLDHLLGDHASARAKYLSVAQRPGTEATVLSRAAQLFSEGLEQSTRSPQTTLPH